MTHVKEKLKADRDDLKKALKETNKLYEGAKKHHEYVQAVDAHSALKQCNEELEILLKDGEILEGDKLDELKDLLSELKFNESVLEYKRERARGLLTLKKDSNQMC